MNAIKPPLAYYGAKTTIGPKIAALFPDHEHYVEWHRHEIRTATGQAAQWSPRTEVLWSNRPFPVADGLWDELVIA